MSSLQAQMLELLKSAGGNLYLIGIAARRATDGIQGAELHPGRGPRRLRPIAEPEAMG
jgi:hypothetical protein